MTKCKTLLTGRHDSYIKEDHLQFAKLKPLYNDSSLYWKKTLTLGPVVGVEVDGEDALGRLDHHRHDAEAPLPLLDVLDLQVTA